MSLLARPPVSLHVTSSRKVLRSADGIINIIQEISFYAEGAYKSHAGKQLREVHSSPEPEVRGRFSAETNVRVFVGERLIRMLIQTAIRPNTSDSLEIDELFHFAERADAIVVPIAFEATMEHLPGEQPAVHFDLSAAIVVCLKQRILKHAGEQYKVLQAIELRANDSQARPTQELVRKSTLTQPASETAPFRERIFTGTDVARVDRDISFVVDRPVLHLSERREYIPSYPVLPRRRSSSLRLSHTPTKPRSRSQTRSWTDSEINYPTAREDLPTALSPYSLASDKSGVSRTRSNSAPGSDRTGRSTRKKWTVNSVVAKAGASTPETYARALTARSLSTARNLSLSPYFPTDRPRNGEIGLVPEVPVPAPTELGPHGEDILAEGSEVLKVAAPVDSLYGLTPRSSSDCSTASAIPSDCPSDENLACHSAPYSPVRSMPRTPLNSASRDDASPSPTVPTEVSVSPAAAPHTPVYIARQATPMVPAYFSPIQTAVHLEKSASKKSKKSQRSQRLSKRSFPQYDHLFAAAPIHTTSAELLDVSRNLFGTQPSDESVASAFILPREKKQTTVRSSRATKRSHKKSKKAAKRAVTPLETAMERSVTLSEGSSSASELSPGRPRFNYGHSSPDLHTGRPLARSPYDRPPASTRSARTATARALTTTTDGSSLPLSVSPTPPRTLPAYLHSLDVMEELPGITGSGAPMSLRPVASPLQHTAILGGGALPTNVHQAAAAAPGSPQVDAGSPSDLATARGHTRSGGMSRSLAYSKLPPMEKAARSRSKSPAASSEHHTMHEARAGEEEDSYSESAQVTYNQTAEGFAQKPTHSASLLSTGQQRTPTKTENPTLYYSSRQTTPARTHNEETKRTPARDPATAFLAKQPQNLTPNCSLRSGCQAVHESRKIVSVHKKSPKPPPQKIVMIGDGAAKCSLKTGCQAVHEPRKAGAEDSPGRTVGRKQLTTPSAAPPLPASPSPYLRTAASDNDNEDVKTGLQDESAAAAAAAAAVAASPPVDAAGGGRPRIVMRASQADGKIHVEVSLALNLARPGAIRLRAEMAPQLRPRAVAVNGQQIWSAPDLQ